MKRSLSAVTSVLAVIGLSAGTRAAMNDSAGINPYAAIADRNVFDLKPPPVIENKPPPPQAPPSTIKLTGITTLFGLKQACVAVSEAAPPGKPPPKPKYYTMTEGQRQGGLEVVAIDVKGQTVKIINDGSPFDLIFEKSKTPAGPVPGGMPPPGPGGRVFQAPVPTYAPPGAPVMPNYANPGRPGGNGANNNGMNNNNAANAAYNQVARPMRTEQQISPDEQIIMMELERERTRESVANGTLPPIPNTPLTEEITGGGGGPPPAPASSHWLPGLAARCGSAPALSSPISQAASPPES